MDSISIDDIIQLELDNCYDCGIELNENNRSMWQRFATVNGEIVTVPQCKSCDEKFTKEMVGKEIR